MLAKALHHNLIKLWSSLTGADLISILFLAVTIPHTTQVLQGYETGEWHWLAWSLAGAIDIGIAYGGLVSADSRVDTQARRWAILLFIGLSVGSYRLNVEHYLQARADTWWSYGLGLLLPGGILVLAKIKSRIITVRLANALQAQITQAETDMQHRAILSIEAEQTRFKLEVNTAFETALSGLEHRLTQERLLLQGSLQEHFQQFCAEQASSLQAEFSNLRNELLQQFSTSRMHDLASLAKAKESDGIITRPFTLAAPNENGNSSKLTRQQTEAIRNRILAGELSLAQAREQGVPEGTIYSWKSRYGNQVRLN